MDNSIKNTSLPDKLIWYCILLFAASNIFTIAIVQISAASILMLFIFKKIYSGNYKLSANPLNYPFLIFIAVRILSIFLSEYFQLSLIALYKEIPFYFLFYVFINEIDISDNSKITLLVRIIILSGIVASLYGIAGFFFLDKSRISSTTSGYYTLGMYLTATISISMMLGDQKGIFPNRLLWWISNIILIAGIFLTLNRMHWIAMTVIVIISGLMKERKLLIAYFILAVLAFYFIPSILERVIQALREHNISERDIIWKGAFILIDQHPFFGFGQFTFTKIFPLYNEIFDKGVASWHNDFIQIYIESGLTGILCFLYLLGTVFHKGIYALRLFKLADLSFEKSLLSGLLLSILSFIIGGFIPDPITSLQFILIFSLTAILVKYPSRLGLQSQ